MNASIINLAMKHKSKQRLLLGIDLGDENEI